MREGLHPASTCLLHSDLVFAAGLGGVEVVVGDFDYVDGFASYGTAKTYGDG